MQFNRSLASSYVLVFGGLLLGLFVGVFVVDADPKVLGWLFGAGGGLATGAFIAALTSGDQLVGSGQRQRERYAPLDDWDDADPRH